MYKHFHYVLSMGAVFAIFAGSYYWFGKITGYLYSETLGKIHFWVTFLGVNITFFPMHFLGLSGMPRRIPDYPDMYSKLNFLCSIGSIITFLGVILWFFIVFLAYYEKIECPKNPWQFYSNYPLLLNRFYKVALYLSSVNALTNTEDLICNKDISHLFKTKNNFVLKYNPKNYKVDTLEWVLDSPPALHTFVSSPKIVTTSKNYFFYKYKKKMNTFSTFSWVKKQLVTHNSTNSSNNSIIYNNIYTSPTIIGNIPVMNSHMVFFSTLQFNKNCNVSVAYNSKYEETNITSLNKLVEEDEEEYYII